LRSFPSQAVIRSTFHRWRYVLGRARIVHDAAFSGLCGADQLEAVVGESIAQRVAVDSAIVD